MEKQPGEINSGSALKTETNVLRDGESLKPSNSSSQVNRSVSNDDEGEVQYLTGVKLTLVILAVTAIALLVMIDMSIVATVRRLPRLGHLSNVDSYFLFHKKATPKMTSDFHTTAGVGWYGSAYLLTR